MRQQTRRTVALATAGALALGGAAVGGAAIASATNDAERCAATIETVREVLASSRPAVTGELPDQQAWEAMRVSDTELLWLDTGSCREAAPSLEAAVRSTHAAHVDLRDHLLRGSPAAWIRARVHLLEAERHLDTATAALAADKR